MPIDQERQRDVHPTDRDGTTPRPVCAILFSERVWRHAQVLLAGAILAPGKRTVGAALRVMDLGRTEQYQRYHRVLNRAVWSSREASRVLLGLLVKTFVSEGKPLVIGRE